MSDYPVVILKSGKDQSIMRFHPWVFTGAIKKIHGNPVDGDVVKVINNKDEFLGYGHYSEGGSIAVRVFSFKEGEINDDFWFKKLNKAFQHRESLGLTQNEYTNCYRLVFAEGDGLPGLIIDIYNGVAIIQAHSIGMHLIKDVFADALKDIYKENLHAVYDKSAESIHAKSYKTVDGYIYGNPPKEHFVLEYGHKFLIDWKEGQKTGFFIDQRENRQLLTKYCNGKKVLNTFSYTGGFSVYAVRAGAELVHSVDSSKKAVEMVDKNMVLNDIDASKYESFASDTFNFLKDKEDVYDVIILDPPAFAKHKDVRHHAVMGYKRLNAEAMKMIKKGGIIFTFSCSQVVDKYIFNNTIMSAAIQAGREVKILHHLSQPPDHPVSVFHPEGEYLKGLVLRVD